MRAWLSKALIRIEKEFPNIMFVFTLLFLFIIRLKFPSHKSIKRSQMSPARPVQVSFVCFNFQKFFESANVIDGLLSGWGVVSGIETVGNNLSDVG